MRFTNLLKIYTSKIKEYPKASKAMIFYTSLYHDYYEKKITLGKFAMHLYDAIKIGWDE